MAGLKVRLKMGNDIYKELSAEDSLGVIPNDHL